MLMLLKKLPMFACGRNGEWAKAHDMQPQPMLHKPDARTTKESTESLTPNLFSWLDLPSQASPTITNGVAKVQPNLAERGANRSAQNNTAAFG